MKSIFIFLFFLLTKTVISQIKIDYHFSPIYLGEREKPYTFKRSKNFNAVYNIGFGADIFLNFSKYNFSRKSAFSVGPSVGQYYFWNNRVKKNDYPFEYTENNLVSPILLNLGFAKGPSLKGLTAKSLIFGLYVGFGRSYIQHSVKNINTIEIITDKKWADTFKFKVNFIFWKYTKFFPLICFGFEYTYMDKRHFTGANF